MISTSFLVASIALAAVLVMMVGELDLSRRNERELRRRRALEPSGDVYRTMRWAYPVAFVAMAIEGAISEGWPARAVVTGAIVFATAKALKFWAIASLGQRWTFRVLILPDEPLVTRGPYAFLRHPNYLAVVGELAGMYLIVGARMTGPIVIVLFSLLLQRRIRIEDRALRHSPCS